MNKLTTAALAGLVAVTATAGASMSRWNGFGAANAYIADVQDIWTLPGVVASHKNAMYLELGKNNIGYEAGENWGSDGNSIDDIYQDLAPNTAWGGVNTQVGPGVLSIWINRPYTEGGFDAVGYEYGRPGASGLAFNWAFSIDNTLDILYGFDLSDSTTLGVSISRAAGYKQNKTETNAGTSSSTRDFQDLGLGLGVEQKEVGPIALLEVGLTINTLSGVNEAKNTTQTDKYNRSGMDLDLRIGGDLAGDDGAFGRVELGLQMDNFTYKNEPQTAPPANSYVEGKNNGLGYNVGYAMGKSGDKGMGLVGLMLYSRSDNGDAPNYGALDTNKVSINEFRLELATAAEAKLKEWLTIRAGLSGNLLYNFSYKTESGLPGAVTTNTYTSTERWDAYGPYSYNNLAKATMGTTLTFGNLSIDGVLNQDLLYTGSYLISGVQTALSSQVSATWGW
jgi:hypothetical protein